MQAIETRLSGVFKIQVEKQSDCRGFFARCWDQSWAREKKFVENFEQWSLSMNTKRGTLRGLHWQREPHAETKLVRCLRGNVWDVVVDIRSGSATFRQWIGISLDGSKMEAVYIPAGYAHGYITLTDDTLLQYGIAGQYSPEHQVRARWDDPNIAIDWPIKPTTISDRDAAATEPL